MVAAAGGNCHGVACVGITNFSVALGCRRCRLFRLSWWFVVFLTDNGEPLGHLRVNFYQKSEFHLGDSVYGDGDCLNPGCLAGNPRI